MKYRVAAGLLLVPQFAHAATAAAAQPESLLVPALKMLGALALVVGLLLLIYAASRKGFGFLPRRREGQLIHMVETRPLGGKKFLCLVRVRNQELLLGVSGERIECLTHLPGSAGFGPALQQAQDEIQASGESQ